MACCAPPVQQRRACTRMRRARAPPPNAPGCAARSPDRGRAWSASASCEPGNQQNLSGSSPPFSLTRSMNIYFGPSLTACGGWKACTAT
jgi:hypothetical protein